MRIRTKIILTAALVLTLSLLCSGVLASLYFSNIMQQQALQNDRVKLQQSAQHLNLILNDIRMIASNAVIDPYLQDYMNDTEGRLFRTAKDIAPVQTRLDYLINLRDYINNAVLVRRDGRTVWSRATHEPYDRQLTEEWFLEFLAENRSVGFSRPHEPSSPLTNSGTEISYIFQFGSLNRLNEPLGHVVLNLRLSYFTSLLEVNRESFDGFALYDHRGEPVFGWGDSYLEPFRASGEKLVEASDGFYLQNTDIAEDWRIAGYTLKSRSSGVVRNVHYIFLAVNLASLILTLCLVLPLAQSMTKPIARLMRAMKEVAAGNLNARVTVTSRDEIRFLGDVFNRMTAQLKEHVEASVEQEKTLRLMENELLIAQINPHFIYNTLVSVISLARMRGNDDIVRMVESFVTILQDAVGFGQSNSFSTVEQEVEIVRHYATIQAFRYGDRFEIQYAIDDAVRHARMPRSMLQPLVENAILHGICAKDGNGTIIVSAAKEDGRLVLRVRDDGAGMPPDVLEKVRTGENVRSPGVKMRNIGLPNIRHMRRPRHPIPNRPSCAGLEPADKIARADDEQHALRDRRRALQCRDIFRCRMNSRACFILTRFM